MVASIRFCQGCVCRMLVLVRNSASREGSDLEEMPDLRSSPLRKCWCKIERSILTASPIHPAGCWNLKFRPGLCGLHPARKKKAQVWQYQQQKSRTTSPHASFWYWRCRGQHAVLCFFVWAWSELFLWPVNSITHLLLAGDSGCFDPFLGDKETFNIIQQSRTLVDDLLLHVAQISCWGHLEAMGDRGLDAGAGERRLSLAWWTCLCLEIYHHILLTYERLLSKKVKLENFWVKTFLSYRLKTWWQ